MPRTKEADVAEILGDNYDTINTPSLFPYIRAAYLITSRVIECAEQRGEDISNDEAKEIERWVAAHLYTINDPLYKSKQTANSSATFNDHSYLDGANALDPSGCVNTIFKGTNAFMFWLGLAPSEQTDYVDRS